MQSTARTPVEVSRLPHAAPDDDGWARWLAGDAGGDPHGLFAPLLKGSFVLGRSVQSLDGKIATATGKSFWIGGAEDRLHTHRLRAICDAVLVGAGTVQADDPLLTTRLCVGPSPLRVVIDTNRTLSPNYRLFAGGPPTLLLCAEDAAGPDLHGSAAVARVARVAGAGLDLACVLDVLAQRGHKRIFVEGGGITVSRFLVAGLLDRLHVTIAPVLLGAGVPALTLPGVDDPAQGQRLAWTAHRVGADLLLDVTLARQ